MIESVTLIIPSQNAEMKLITLLKHISNWQVMPNEIIIIDSSDSKLNIPLDTVNFFKTSNITLKIIYGSNMYPGHARNIGISNSTNSILAFLDTSTFPSQKWLGSGLELINSNDLQGVWGNTFYEAEKYIAKIIRACTYGEKPIKTFPGSILKKNIFNRCGLFVESARAGEDGDWMTRAELQKINISSPQEHLIYDDLDNIGIKLLLKKWFRNYIFTAELPFFRAHKDIYYYVTSFLAVLLAYNWNAVLAAWDMNSIFYIPNITKISMIIIFLAYIFVRGIYLPLKKGVNIYYIFPINFVFISFISILLDVTKIAAFMYSKFLKND